MFQNWIKWGTYLSWLPHNKGVPPLGTDLQVLSAKHQRCVTGWALVEARASSRRFCSRLLGRMCVVVSGAWTSESSPVHERSLPDNGFPIRGRPDCRAGAVWIQTFTRLAKPGFGEESTMQYFILQAHTFGRRFSSRAKAQSTQNVSFRAHNA